jgi:ABC-2 type transport system ATP-binding protein
MWLAIFTSNHQSYIIETLYGEFKKIDDYAQYFKVTTWVNYGIIMMVGTEKYLPAVEFEQVSKSYGTKMAVAQLDLLIGQGGVTSLLGPNGAGKSTTIHMLLGILPPDTGTVRLFRKEPTIARNRQVIGSMLQNIGAPDTLKVGELIRLWSSYYPRHLATSTVLEMAGLTGIANQWFGRLSGGQRRLVAFALAICGNPSILVLDEPTVGLDLASRHRFWQLTRQFAEQGKTILLSTHYLEEANMLADRIVVMNHGQVIADGSAATIKQQVSGRLIRCHTKIDIATIQALPSVISVSAAGRLLQIIASPAETVVTILLQLDPELSDLEVVGIGLEEAFLALTNVPAQPARDLVMDNRFDD